MDLSTLFVGDTDQQLIDVHAHFLTESYVNAARAAGHVHPDGMADWPKWSAGEHLRLMDRWGVATAMLPISSPGTYFGDDAAARRLTREVNESGAAISQAHPGRFGHFASLPLPDVDGALDELGYAIDELGSDGIIVETNSAGVYLGDDRFEPLYRNSIGAVLWCLCIPRHHRAPKRLHLVDPGRCWSSSSTSPGRSATLSSPARWCDIPTSSGFLPMAAALCRCWPSGWSFFVPSFSATMTRTIRCHAS